jgi:hypothetical protein
MTVSTYSLGIAFAFSEYGEHCYGNGARQRIVSAA